MSDYSELRRLAEAAMPRDESPHLPCTVAFDRASSPSIVLDLIDAHDELADLRARLAERDVLIQKAAAHVRPTCHDLYADLMRSLSASAEQINKESSHE